MTNNIIPFSTNNPEVRFDVPLILQIAAFLRHWGYLVCPDDGRGYEHDEYEYEWYVKANNGLVIGQIIESTTEEEKTVRTGFLWLKKETISVSKSKSGTSHPPA